MHQEEGEGGGRFSDQCDRFCGEQGIDRKGFGPGDFGVRAGGGQQVDFLDQSGAEELVDGLAGEIIAGKRDNCGDGLGHTAPGEVI
jgi:hypothetical protein